MKQGMLTIIGAICLIYPFTGVRGGDGEGVSGPDLKGISIPVNTDQLPTVKDLESATKKCGDNLLRSIMRQVLAEDKVDYFKSETHVRGFRHERDEKLKVTYYASMWVHPKESPGAQIQFVAGGPSTVTVEEAWTDRPFQFFQRSLMHVKRFPTTFSLYLSEGLPTLVFTETFQGEFDELGNRVSEKGGTQALAKQLWIHNPESLSEATPMINRTTGVTSKVTVNTVEHSKCLLAEIH